jgi:predicted nucleic acid-binding protein
MIVVSDTSTITNLHKVHQVDLLNIVFGTIIIPEGVYDELAVIPSQKLLLDSKPWIEIKEATDRDLYLQLRESLDHGEAEAISLSLDLGADFLIIDEQKGRQVAKGYGLTIIGLLGVLIEAKNRGALTTVKPTLEALTSNHGFRVSKSLFRKVLKQAGEE